MPQILLRVRTQLGIWRLKDVDQRDTIGQLRTRIEREHKTDLQGKPISLDASGETPLDDRVTVGRLGLNNGDMLYGTVDESKTGVHESTKIAKVITKDGNIIAQEYAETTKQKGFREGMMALGDIKKHWTLADYLSLDERFVYKLKRQEEAVCKKVSIESSSLNDFQQYMWNFDYRKMRVGYLYGSFLENNMVKVEVIYEPPQNTTDTSFEVLNDPNEDRIEALASLLSLQRVGWILVHPPREEGFFMSAAEVIFAAELQLECARGVSDTPFMTVKVTVNAESEVQVEGYQVSKQCMDMVAEGVLDCSANLGSCRVNRTFTAIVEGKEVPEVDTSFFLTVVPIEQFESKSFVSFFPKANREGLVQTRDDLKKQLSKVGKKGWTLVEVLADFHLLLFLCDFLDLTHDLPALCRAVTDRDLPLDEGYQLLLRSLAGLD